MKQLRILHINDLHSSFKSYPQIQHFFENNSIENTLRFDLGDNVDRSHPLTEATKGQANIELLNQLSLTAATVGNNEGLSLEHDDLSHLYDEANFPIVLSNLREKGKLPAWLKESITVETDFGMKVGIIGLTFPYYLAYEPFGWDIEDPYASLDRLLPELNCDFIILLSHLGVKYDEEIAKKYDIDLIIGAHTHHVFEEGVEVDGSLLAAAGSHGEFIGKIDLTFTDDFTLYDWKIDAIPVNSLEIHPEEKKFVQDLEDRGHKLLQDKENIDLGTRISNQFPDYQASHKLAKLIADYAQVPASIVNSGLVVYDLPKIINPDNLLTILPHSMRVVRYKVKGIELKEILKELTDKAVLLEDQRIHGMGFRGKIFGKLVMEGISYDSEKEIFLYQGKPIKDKKSYEFVVPDQYYFAKYFSNLKSMGQKEILFPKFLREIVYDYLRGSND